MQSSPLILFIFFSKKIVYGFLTRLGLSAELDKFFASTFAARNRQLVASTVFSKTYNCQGGVGMPS
jgi:hypothetical protein